MNIQKILEDWENGSTHGQIIHNYPVTRAQEFAITLCSEGLSTDEIEQRLANAKSGMKSAEIKAVMQLKGDL